MAKNSSENIQKSAWSKSLTSLTSRINHPFLFLLDVADKPKTAPCTFYSLFGLQKVIALKVEMANKYSNKQRPAKR